MSRGQKFIHRNIGTQNSKHTVDTYRNVQLRKIDTMHTAKKLCNTRTIINTSSKCNTQHNLAPYIYLYSSYSLLRIVLSNKS